MKNFKVLGFILLIVLLSLNSYAQKNLITNPGFEDDELYAWNNNGAKQTPWAFKSGKNSCAIISQSTEKWVGIDQVIKIPKKVHFIEFSAWLKATNVVKGKNDWDGALFAVVFLDSQDREIGQGTNIAHITGDNDWQLDQAKIKIPDNAVSFKVLAALGNASGTLLVDDVTAKALAD